MSQLQIDFYNTTNETAPILQSYKETAKQQDSLVLGYFIRSMTGTPSEAHDWLISRKLMNPNTPLTSIRRAFNTLTKQGLLRKTESKAEGKYGRPEYIWEKV